MELTIDQALQQGIAAHEEGKLQDAERLYRAILQSQPSHPDANHNLGVLAVSVGKVQEALTPLKLALETNPKQGQFWLSYIDALIKLGQLNNARQILQQGKASGLKGEKVDQLEIQLSSMANSNSPSIGNTSNPSKKQIDGLISLYTQGKLQEAIVQASTLESQFPNYAIIPNVLGAIYKALGRHGDAIASYNKAIELKPDFFEAYNNLGAVLSDSGKYEESITTYNKAIELRSDVTEAHYNLGNALKNIEKNEEAITSYKKAIELKPDYAEAYSNRGITLQELVRLNEAKVSYTQAIALKPDFAEAHNNLGNTFQRLGRLSDAEVSCGQAIAFKPDFAEAYSNLGDTLKELGRMGEAVASYTRASFIEPENPRFYAMRGLTPALITRQPLFNRDGLMNIINDGDWEGSQFFLKQAFNENPTHIGGHVEEFIQLWCKLCGDLLDQMAIKKLIPIFLKMFVMVERNENLNSFIKLLFKNVDIDKILQQQTRTNKIIIKLSYSQYNFLIGEFLQAETLALDSILNAKNLIKVGKTRDLGWLIVRRGLTLCERKDVSRRALTNLISNLED